MFTKSRRRIIAAVVLALTVLITVTAGVIIGFSAAELRRSSSEMLERYIGLYSLDALPGTEAGMLKNTPPGAPPEDSREPIYTLSTFYSAAINGDGQILAVDEGRGGVYDRDAIIRLARDVVESGKTVGQRGVLAYQVEKRGDYTLVAFIDNTVTNSSFHTLLKWMLITDAAALLVLFVLSVYTADRIVAPLEESDRRQKQFVSDAGHELKTPVAVIASNAEVLSRQIGTNVWLGNIQYENEQMGILVTQLLDLSRAENTEPSFVPVDFSRTVTGEVLAFESVAFEQEKELKTDIRSGIIVQGDPARLARLVSILLDNALRHADGDAEILVALSVEGHSAVLRVENDAAEIHVESLDLLFERFRRGDEAQTGSGHYGLGLAIAKAVVESHRGTIKAEQHDGRICFCAALPVEKL